MCPFAFLDFMGLMNAFSGLKYSNNVPIVAVYARSSLPHKSKTDLNAYL